jgi:hypothetical protein
MSTKPYQRPSCAFRKTARRNVRSPRFSERFLFALTRHSALYGTDIEYVRAGLEGRAGERGTGRTVLDWTMLAIATLVFAVLGAIARAPMVDLNASVAVVLLGLIVVILVLCGTALWQTTQFS